MAKNVRVVTARRAYQFRLDDLRLSTLTTTEVATEIQRHFDFKAGTIATPPPVFGLVPETNPPGLVFNHGSIRTSNGAPLLIRFLHFEPQRLVFDVAAPSSEIHEMLGQLRALLSSFPTIDESPILGEPVGEYDYSEVSAQLDIEFRSLVNDPVLNAAKNLSAGGQTGGIPNSISFQVGEARAEAGIGLPNPTIQIRAGTKADERIVYSALWASSDNNVAWLEQLERALAER
jgi:hypothetical protein